MTDRNGAGITEMEKRLRDSMPMLEAPESLSAARVAEKLKSSTARRGTPLYVYARVAVAACLVIAVGAGALMMSGRYLGGGAKKADEAEAVPYEYVPEEKDATESSTAAGSDSQNAAAGLDDGFVKEESFSLAEIVMTAGEIRKIPLDVPFAEADLSVASDDGGEAACKAELEEAENGTAELCITADKPGSAEIQVTVKDEIAYIFRLKVTG